MKIPIESIIVKEETRIRQDPGDLSSLENSIRKVGLLNSVVIDEDNRLIAGYRRLSACRNLGWKEIEANVIEFGSDELKMLDAEVDENLFRKDFTREEIESIERRRQEIIRKLRGNIFQRFWRWLRGLFRRDKREDDVKSEEEGDKKEEVKEREDDRESNKNGEFIRTIEGHEAG
ncbi:MAG TPA: chromosome partitioning protein ParB [Proteobacteria bacterium]|nr:chromosome partitioning protein ParB [Pseudomonadota bacterium]